MYKCRTGNIEGVQQMIHKFGAKQVVDAKETEDFHWTCLHYAAWNGQTNIISLLVEIGADIDPKDRYGETPLRAAIRWQEYSSITTLIKLGASFDMAKVADWGQDIFDASMREEETKDAIAEGQRLTGERRRKPVRKQVREGDYIKD